MFSLHGVGVGGGIAIGRARRLEASERDVPRYHVLEQQVARELGRLETAIEVVKAELQAVGDQLPEEGPAEAKAL
ncbi:MAG TPA: phosphoenolpyruvate-utilizing N-terminal domain-containing protein, partial [Zeimonas sp.]